MERIERNLLLLLPMALLMASCGTTRSTTASVDDDVYFSPSNAPVKASVGRGAPPPEPEPEPAPSTDDYYDANTSQSLGSGNYYDMTYNDPYYYNYGRFGFNSSPMGWQTGWNGPGWGGGMMGGDFGWYSRMGWGAGWQGVGMGWGYGSSIYSGFYRPGWVYDPWMSPNPWGYGGMGMGYGYGTGYGYGNYYGPWGNCYSCYAPVVVGDSWSNNTVVAPRRSVGSGGAGTGVGTRRMPVRNSVGLAPVPVDRNPDVRRTPAVDRRPSTPANDPGRSRPTTLPDRSRERSTPAREPSRAAPSRNHDGGGRSTPAPSRGGGGGGGTRTSPGRR